MTWDGSYPVRVRIKDVTGKIWNGMAIATPEESMPYIGKEGLAEKIPDPEIEYAIRITLDNGHIIYGHECWWEPIV